MKYFFANTNRFLVPFTIQVRVLLECDKHILPCLLNIAQITIQAANIEIEGGGFMTYFSECKLVDFYGALIAN